MEIIYSLYIYFFNLLDGYCFRTYTVKKLIKNVKNVSVKIIFFLVLCLFNYRVQKHQTISLFLKN